MHRIRAELQGKRHGRKRGVQGHALLMCGGGWYERPGCVRLLAVTSVTSQIGIVAQKGKGRWGLEPLTFTVRPGSVRPGVGRPPLSDLAECDFRTRPTFGSYVRYSDGG